jgi:hypothetical protein
MAQEARVYYEALPAELRVKDYPNLWRQPTVDRIAFIGDALMSIDPLGSAFQAAAWLVNAVAPVPKQGQPPASALRRYAKKVSRHFGGHCFLVNDYA